MESIRNKLIYKTEVVEIGRDAKEFKDINMLIFFGEEAPDTLKDSCFITKVTPVNGQIEIGKTLKIGNETYEITAVGNEVATNLNNLGHIAVRFSGETKAELPGSLYVESGKFPEITVGTEVSIY